MNGKRRGFTLVELLIVIVVIGILSAMMIISSTEAVESTKASNIIANLKQMKTAVTAWYLDNYSRFAYIGGSDSGFYVDGKTKIHDYLNKHPEEIKRYFSSNFKLSDGVLNNYKEFYASEGGYSVYMGESNTRCYVVYRISKDNNKKDHSKLREKLKGRAKSAGLLSYNIDRAAGNKAISYDGGNFVFMEVFRLEK